MMRISEKVAVWLRFFEKIFFKDYSAVFYKR